MWLDRSHQYNHYIQNVPDAFKVGELVYTQLQYLLHNVVKDEHAEDYLTADDEVIPRGDVPNQLHRSDLVGRNCSTSGWEFHHQSKEGKPQC